MDDKKPEPGMDKPPAPFFLKMKKAGSKGVAYGCVFNADRFPVGFAVFTDHEKALLYGHLTSSSMLSKKVVDVRSNPQSHLVDISLWLCTVFRVKKDEVKTTEYTMREFPVYMNPSLDFIKEGVDVPIFSGLALWAAAMNYPFSAPDKI